MQVRRNKMQAFIDKGIEPFGRKYDVTHHAQELLDQFENIRRRNCCTHGRSFNGCTWPW